MSSISLDRDQQTPAARDDLGWLPPGAFELAFQDGDGRELGTLPLGPRDLLPMAYCALREATAARTVEPGEACCVAGLQAAEVRRDGASSGTRQWYLVLRGADGQLAWIKPFGTTPFAARACQEALDRGWDATQVLYILRRRRDGDMARLGPMTVALDVPCASPPDLGELTLVGATPTIAEPVYVWPQSVLDRFAEFASANAAVEVLAGVLGRVCWAEVRGHRILLVTVQDVVPVPPELCEPTAASVNVNRQVVQHIRGAKGEAEARLGDSLYELGTLHPHLPVTDEASADPNTAAAEGDKRVAFLSVADRAAMFARYYLPYQVAMIWGVPADGSRAIGQERAGQFRQWCWSSEATVEASTGFYVQR